MYFCIRNSGCSSARLEYASGGRVVAGSNPVIPTKPAICLFVGGWFVFMGKQALFNGMNISFDKTCEIAF